MKLKLVLASALLMAASSAHGAIPQNEKSQKKTAAKVQSKKTLKQNANVNSTDAIMALRLPMENRIMALSRQPNSFENLKKMSFDPNQSLQMRWRALTALARLDFQRARPVLIKALGDKDWFMRNAALVALPAGDKQMNLQWSMQLLEDPALVVRTAAAENLRVLRDRRARESLIKAYNAPMNYKGKQSLWVRHYVARALAEMAIPGEEAFLVGMLNDNDKRIHGWAVIGLERLTGKTLGQHRENPGLNKDHWIAWWKTGTRG